MGEIVPERRALAGRYADLGSATRVRRTEVGGPADWKPALRAYHASSVNTMSGIAELTAKQFAGAIPARLRKRLMLGQFESSEDVAALRSAA
jgi:hypothetical protein